jgi:DNA-binding NarL/FixJ family response regulator
VLRVFIADGSSLVRERLAELISAVGDVELVGQADNARGTILAIQRLQPDVAIMDIRMAGGDGLRVLETVKAGESPPVVIVLAAFPYPQHRQKCLEAGAEYFLDKATEFDQIAKVLRGVGRGRFLTCIHLSQTSGWFCGWDKRETIKRFRGWCS